MRNLAIAALLLLVGCDVRKTVVQPLGLITRPNKYGQFPPGALETAYNIMMRDRGILRSFPDVQTYRADVLSSGNTVRRMFPAPASLLVLGESGGTWGARWVTGAASNSITMPTGVTLSVGTGKGGEVKARDRYIVATTTDPVVMDSEGDTTARYAGILAPAAQFNGFTATAGQAVATGKYVGYRVTIRRKTSDGYVLTSPPCQQFIVNNISGSTGNFTVYVNWNTAYSNVIAGDVVDVWRTKEASTSGVGDTHFLAVSKTLSSTDITNAYTTLLDVTPESGLGQELYTNPGQTNGVLSGIGRAEGAPPSATEVATFRGSTFYVSSALVSSVAVRISAKLGDLSSTAERTYGIGSRATTGDVTNGSAAILNVANTTGLAVGQALFSTTYFAITSRIASIVGTTVTMTTTATGPTTVGASHTFLDIIQVNAIEIYPYTAVSQVNTVARVDYSTISISTSSGNSSTTTTGTDVFASNFRCSQSALTIRATNGSNYYPALPNISETVLTATSDARTNRIHWSLLDQPEAVPVLNYAFIGNGTIYRIIPTRDALWIFCSDGLFRLSGAGGIWRVDPVDPGLTLVARKAVCVLGQDVWAYTNRGLVVITSEGAVTKVSEDIIGDVVPGAQFADTWDTFMAADEKHGEVWLTFRTGTSSLTYVYNTRTGAFTNLFPNAAANGLDIADDAFAMTDMVFYPASDTLAYGAKTGSSGADCDVGTFVADTSSSRFVGVGQLAIFQPIAPVEPFSVVQFIDVTWVFESAEALVFSPRFGAAPGTDVTIVDGGAEDRVTIGVPRTAAINHRLRPGFNLVSSAKNWSMRGFSFRWVLLTEQSAR